MEFAALVRFETAPTCGSVKECYEIEVEKGDENTYNIQVLDYIIMVMARKLRIFVIDCVHRTFPDTRINVGWHSDARQGTFYLLRSCCINYVQV